MCAISHATVAGLEVDLYMGYNGPEITVNGIKYEPERKHDYPAGRRHQVKSALMSVPSVDLAELMLRLVEKSQEG